MPGFVVLDLASSIPC